MDRQLHFTLSFFRRLIASYPLFSALLAISIRAVPEVLMSPWPSGFDVITYYAPYIYNMRRYGFWIPLLRIVQGQTAPLTYVILNLVGYLVPLDHMLIVKIMSPLVYGFLGLTIYRFVKELFKSEPRKTFFVTVIALIYFVSLRFSWDMWRNTLGLAFFLLASAHLKREEIDKFVVWSILSMLTHELMPVLLCSIVPFILLRGISGRTKRSLNRIRLLVLTAVECSALVAVGYYGGWLRVFPPLKPDLPVELVSSGRPQMIPYNYLGSSDWYNYTSEADVRIEASMLMIKMYGPILPLAILGWRKDEWITFYIAISVLPFISIILAPSMAIPNWHRFALLLTIPLTICAANFLSEKKRLKIFYLVLLAAFAFGYIALWPEYVFPYYAIFPPTYRYMPTSMLQNSIPIEDSANVVESIRWLSSNAEGNSCLLVHEAYLGWAALYLEKEDITIVPYNLSLATPIAAGRFYSHIYLIWWTRNVSTEWHPPAQFRQIYPTGRIAIYEYQKS